jgi:hypothetical protein
MAPIIDFIWLLQVGLVPFGAVFVFFPKECEFFYLLNAPQCLNDATGDTRIILGVFLSSMGLMSAFIHRLELRQRASMSLPMSLGWALFVGTKLSYAFPLAASQCPYGCQFALFLKIVLSSVHGWIAYTHVYPTLSTWRIFALRSYEEWLWMCQGVAFVAVGLLFLVFPHAAYQLQLINHIQSIPGESANLLKLVACGLFAFGCLSLQVLRLAPVDGATIRMRLGAPFITWYLYLIGTQLVAGSQGRCGWGCRSAVMMNVYFVVAHMLVLKQAYAQKRGSSGVEKSAQKFQQ